MHRSERCCVALSEIENLDSRQRTSGADFLIAGLMSYRLGRASSQHLCRMFAMFGREAIRMRRRSAEAPWDFREQHPSRFWMRELFHKPGFEQESIVERVDERAKNACTRHSGRFEFCDPMCDRRCSKFRIEQCVERGAIGNAIGVVREAPVASELRFVESAA